MRRAFQSIRSRVLLAQLLAFAACWAFILAIHARGETGGRQDRGAFARLLADLAEHAQTPERFGALTARWQSAAGAFQIMDASGRVVWRTLETPLEPFPLTADGFVRIGDQDWSLASALSQGGHYRAVVGSRLWVSPPWLPRVSWVLLLVLVVGSLPGLLILPWSLRKVMRPVDDLAAQVAARHPRELSPLEPGLVLRETRPLVDEINRLLARLREALDLQKRFLADAAHELRTPLAAVSSQAHVLSREEDEGAREAAKAELDRGLDRAAEMITQLLTVARLDAAPLAEPLALHDVGALLREQVAEVTPKALARAQDIAAETPESLRAWVAPRTLASALGNLLQNAVRHGRPGGRIQAGARAEAQGVVLWVSDDGPGIPAADLGRAQERFVRLSGAGEGGCGLGLAIVKAAAERHGGSLHFTEGLDGTGLRVELRIPAARAASLCSLP